MKVNDALEILEKDKFENSKKGKEQIEFCVSTLRKILEEFVDVLNYDYDYREQRDIADYSRSGLYIEITNKNYTRTLFQPFQPKIVVFVHNVYFDFDKAPEEYHFTYNKQTWFQINDDVKIAKFLLYVIEKLKL